MQSTVGVDHVIFYAGRDIESYGALFEELGFFVTPLTHHSTGSVNRLVILDGSYLEIVGLPYDAGPEVRPELQVASPGLNGVAFTETVAHQEDYLRLHFKSPTTLRRKVEINGEHHEASFRLHTLKTPASELRVFLCHHFTPSLIWRDEWKRHPNRATRLLGLELPPDMEASLRPAFESALALSPSDAYDRQYRAQETVIEFSAQPESVDATAIPVVRLAVSDIDHLKRVISSTRFPHGQPAANSVAVNAGDALGVRFVFSTAP